MGAKGHEAQRELRGEDIGHGVHIRFYTMHGDPQEQKAGLIVAHRHADGAICEGGVSFDVPVNPQQDRPRWTVESWEPLTLSPSILDKECGLHGYIREGRWVPA